MRGFRRGCPLGEMRIIARDGSWDLYIEEQFVETYYAPMRAIYDLLGHTTGYPPWDRREDLEMSDELEEWDLLA